MSETQPRIEQLKAKAALLGITHSPNIGPDTLQAKINTHLAQSNESAPEDEHAVRERKIKEATKLVRVIITCMDQSKTESGERTGEYFMVSNSVIGTIKRLVPYGHPTHVEQALLNVIKERKYQQRYGPGNQKTREVKEFAVDILPDLTIKEAEDLKKMQAIRAEASNY